MLFPDKLNVPATVAQQNAYNNSYDWNDEVDDLLNLFLRICGCVPRKRDLRVGESNKEKENCSAYGSTGELGDAISDSSLVQPGIVGFHLLFAFHVGSANSGSCQQSAARTMFVRYTLRYTMRP